MRGHRGEVGLAAAGGATVGLGVRGHQLRVERGVQRVLEQDDRLGAQLGDPRLGDAELGGELGHRPLVEEVALHHDPQPLGQLRHRVVQVGELLPMLEDVDRGQPARRQDVVHRAVVEALQ